MKSQIVLFTLAVALVISVTPAFAAILTWEGYRTSPAASGIFATDGWDNGGFRLDWRVDYDTELLNWTYTYSVTAEHKDLSHWILQLSQYDAYRNDITGDWEDIFGAENVDTWGPQGNSNPGMPASMFGVKFPTATPTAFTSDQEPVWGNFYAKDGSEDGEWVYAYNAGFMDVAPSLDLSDFPTVLPDYVNWIPRPDGTGGEPPVIPEPGTFVIWSLLGAGTWLAVTLWRRKRNPADFGG